MKNLNSSHKVKKIGIWIETPGQAFTVGEGIARVILFLVSSWEKQGLQISIYCSDKCVDSVLRVSRDMGLVIDPAKNRFVTATEITWVTRKLTHLVNLYNDKIYRNKLGIKDSLKIVYQTAKAIFQKVKGNHQAVVPDLNMAVKSGVVASWMLFKICLLLPIKFFFARLNSIKLFRADYKQSLLKKALSFRPDAWYIPRPDWHLAQKLEPRLIWAFWDFIPVEALIHFPIDTSIAAVKAGAGGKGEIVTMSNYVRLNHCVKLFNVQPDMVRAKQPPFHLAVNKIDRSYAAEALPRLMAEWVQTPAARTVNSRYIADFPFDKVDFIFLPTQIRGYKNFFNVVLAVEQIIRRKRVDIKLVTTGDLNSEFAQDALKYMRNRGLVFDILSVPGLSTEALNCFFKLSKAVICPAFTEGGIPLSFMEGAVHGTPVAIARMPNMLEFIDVNDPVAQKYSFDPSSVDAIMASLLYVLNNRDEVVQQQTNLVKDKFNYNWDDYAKFVLGE